MLIVKYYVTAGTGFGLSICLNSSVSIFLLNISEAGKEGIGGKEGIDGKEGIGGREGIEGINPLALIIKSSIDLNISLVFGINDSIFRLESLLNAAIPKPIVNPVTARVKYFKPLPDDGVGVGDGGFGVSWGLGLSKFVLLVDIWRSFKNANLFLFIKKRVWVWFKKKEAIA